MNEWIKTTFCVADFDPKRIYIPFELIYVYTWMINLGY